MIQKYLALVASVGLLWNVAMFSNDGSVGPSGSAQIASVPTVQPPNPPQGYTFTKACAQGCLFVPSAFMAAGMMYFIWHFCFSEDTQEALKNAIVSLAAVQAVLIASYVTHRFISPIVFPSLAHGFSSLCRSAYT